MGENWIFSRNSGEVHVLTLEKRFIYQNVQLFERKPGSLTYKKKNNITFENLTKKKHLSVAAPPAARCLLLFYDSMTSCCDVM